MHKSIVFDSTHQRNPWLGLRDAATSETRLRLADKRQRRRWRVPEAQGPGLGSECINVWCLTAHISGTRCSACGMQFLPRPWPCSADKTAKDMESSRSARARARKQMHLCGVFASSGIRRSACGNAKHDAERPGEACSAEYGSDVKRERRL